MREKERDEGRGRDRQGGMEERGGYQSHRDESAFVRLFIISLYHSLDHHNTATMLKECSNPLHTNTHTLMHILPSLCPSIQSSSLS